MVKTKLGIIFGGQSTEHDVSNVSGTSVIKHLDKSKYEITPIYIDTNGNWYKYIKDIKEIDILKIGDQPQELEKIDNIIDVLKEQEVVFPVLHGLYGEDGTIQGLLELLKIPYVGCGVLASSICMDKIYTKIILEKAGIKQAKAVVLNVNNSGELIYINEKLDHIKKRENEICEIIEEKLGYPVFVKPSNSGSSVGINKAANKEELIKNINIASKIDNEILVEEAILGREIECAIIGNEDVKASCVGEILSADEFYDFDAKYKNPKSRTIIPANIEEDVEDEIKNIAIKAFKAVNGKGIARVDFFVKKETSEIYLNEINTMPGFTKISMYPKLWEAENVSYSELLDELVRLAIES